MKRLPRRLALWGGAVAIAGGGFAFMANNAVSASSAGEGFNNISGYTVSGITYNDVCTGTLPNKVCTTNTFTLNLKPNVWNTSAPKEVAVTVFTGSTHTTITRTTGATHGGTLQITLMTTSTHAKAYYHVHVITSSPLFLHTITGLDVAAKLARLGVAVRPGEVVTPVRAAVLTLHRMGAKAPYLVVDERLEPEFSSLTLAGVFPDPPTERPDFIVVGDIGERWDYGLMSSLFAMISDGARLLALHKGRAWQTGSGLALDIGAFVAGLEYASGSEAIVTGKPSADFFLAALSAIGVTPAEAVMIGDDIDGDIGGAQSAGIRGVLVRTGKYRREHVERSGVTPWRTVDSLASLESLPELGP